MKFELLLKLFLLGGQAPAGTVGFHDSGGQALLTPHEQIQSPGVSPCVVVCPPRVNRIDNPHRRNPCLLNYLCKNEPNNQKLRPPCMDRAGVGGLRLDDWWGPWQRLDVGPICVAVPTAE